MSAVVDLPSESTVRVTRTFRAPRALVWRAHTEPALIRRWMLGPDGWSMPVCEVDLRVGGAYRYRWRSDADGGEFGFEGVHHEITAPERLVTTERMEGAPGPGARNTLALTEQDGVTTVVLTMDYGTRELRDTVLATGMTDGMEAGFARLEGVLATA